MNTIESILFAIAIIPTLAAGAIMLLYLPFFLWRIVKEESK